jgi:hypothetical protein
MLLRVSRATALPVGSARTATMSAVDSSQQEHISTHTVQTELNQTCAVSGESIIMEGLLSVWALWLEFCVGKARGRGTLMAEWGARNLEGGRRYTPKVMRIVL